MRNDVCISQSLDGRAAEPEPVIVGGAGAGDVG